MEKKTKKSGLIISLLSLLCIGATAGMVRKKEKEPPHEESTIIEKGIVMRRLTSNDNSYGEKDEVFSYSFTPYNATNQQVEATLKYVDDSDCSAAMEYAIDQDKHLVTLTCKKPFNKQIIFVLISKEKPTAKATIVLDYVRKLKSISVKQNNFAIVNDYAEWSSAAYERIYDFKVTNFLDAIYTECTKTNGAFVYTMKVQAVALVENTTDLSKTYTDNMARLLELKLSKITTTEYACLTAEDLWKLAATNSDKSALKKLTKEDVLKKDGYLNYNISVTISSASAKKSCTGIIHLTYFMYGNYTGDVGVDSIASEVVNINF